MEVASIRTTNLALWGARFVFMVPELGFEPRCLAALPPQDSVSTNFTIRAHLKSGLCRRAGIQRVCAIPRRNQGVLIPAAGWLIRSCNRSRFSACGNRTDSALLLYSLLRDRGSLGFSAGKHGHQKAIGQKNYCQN